MDSFLIHLPLISMRRQSDETVHYGNLHRYYCCSKVSVDCRILHFLRLKVPVIAQNTENVELLPNLSLCFLSHLSVAIEMSLAGGFLS